MSWSTTLVASNMNDIDRFGDKSALQTISSLPGVKFPLMFEIRSNNLKAYAGVLEFIAPEGHIQLPKNLYDSLDLSNSENAKVTIKYVNLPKATYVKLNALDNSFMDIPDYKATLENGLRQSYTVLAEGDIISLPNPHNKNDFMISVNEVKPSPAACIVNTDCEVEFVENVEDSGGTMTSSNNSVGGNKSMISLSIGEFKDINLPKSSKCYFKVFISPSIPKLPMKFLSVKVDFLHETDGNTFISTDHILYPNIMDHQWSITSIGGGEADIYPKEPSSKTSSIETGTYYIGVDSSPELTVNNTNNDNNNNGLNFRISVNLKDQEVNDKTNNDLQLDVVDSSPSINSTEVIRCTNCFQNIPKKAFMMHQMHCLRNQRKCSVVGCNFVIRRGEEDQHWHCPRCDEVMTVREGAKHMKVFHTPMTCECGVNLELNAMKSHRQNECPHRIIRCKFCGDTVQAGECPKDMRDRFAGLTGHESYCGSRTAPCDVCSRIVKLKDIEYHYKLFHPESNPNSNDATIDDNNNNNNNNNSGVSSIFDGWQCGKCSMSNSSKDLHCISCGSLYYTNDDGYGGVDDISNSTTTSSPSTARSPQICINQCCEKPISKSGEAKELNMCAACYRFLIQPFDSEETQRSNLVKVYINQLHNGCFREMKTCNNIYCKNHPDFIPNENITNIAIQSIQLASESAADPPNYYICSVPFVSSNDAYKYRVANKNSHSKSKKKEELYDTRDFDTTDPSITSSGGRGTTSNDNKFMRKGKKKKKKKYVRNAGSRIANADFL